MKIPQYFEKFRAHFSSVRCPAGRNDSIRSGLNYCRSATRHKTQIISSLLPNISVAASLYCFPDQTGERSSGPAISDAAALYTNTLSFIRLNRCRQLPGGGKQLCLYLNTCLSGYLITCLPAWIPVACPAACFFSVLKSPFCTRNGRHFVDEVGLISSKK